MVLLRAFADGCAACSGTNRRRSSALIVPPPAIKCDTQSIELIGRFHNRRRVPPLRRTCAASAKPSFWSTQCHDVAAMTRSTEALESGIASPRPASARTDGTFSRSTSRIRGSGSWRTPHERARRGDASEVRCPRLPISAMETASFGYEPVECFGGRLGTEAVVLPGGTAERHRRLTP